LAPETELSPGHLDITDDIKASFKSLLEQQGIELEFSYGHWAGLAQDVGRFDLVLTAETIYAEESVDDLLSVLTSSSRSVQGGSVEKGMDKMSMQDKDNWTEDIRNETVILVAAKVSSPLC
jgi:protein-histidine N-methyltransferase